MRKFLVSLSALALSAGVANAGALVAPAVEPVITAPAPIITLPAAMPWAGGYAGLGLSFGRSNFRMGAVADDDDDLDDLLDDFEPALTRQDAWPRARGWGLGGFVGYNWQADNLVFGVEGHLSAHRLRGSTARTATAPVALGGGSYDADVRTNIRSMGSLRARVGFAADQTLVFVTAGPAMANLRHEATITGGVLGAEGRSYSESQTVRGWVVGVGIEHSMANGWGIRADLEHHRFRGRDFDTAGADARGVGFIGATFPGVGTRVNVARVSAVFRF